jgi:hypothetical protein
MVEAGLSPEIVGNVMQLAEMNVASAVTEPKDSEGSVD